MEEFFCSLLYKLGKKRRSWDKPKLTKLMPSYQRRGYPLEKIDKCFADEVHGRLSLGEIF